MTLKHTPGPWACSPQPDTGIDITIVSERYAPRPYVASITWGTTDLFRAENIANAQLIAAAPELLAALQALQQAVHDAHLLDVKKRFDLCIADAAAGQAIAKAEGRL